MYKVDQTNLTDRPVYMSVKDRQCYNCAELMLGQDSLVDSWRENDALKVNVHECPSCGHVAGFFAKHNSGIKPIDVEFDCKNIDIYNRLYGEDIRIIPLRSVSGSTIRFPDQIHYTLLDSDTDFNHLSLEEPEPGKFGAIDTESTKLTIKRGDSISVPETTFEQIHSALIPDGESDTREWFIMDNTRFIKEGSDTANALINANH